MFSRRQIKNSLLYETPVNLVQDEFNAKMQRAQREERKKLTKGQKNAPQSRAFEMSFN
jgi:hypothetical protein